MQITRKVLGHSCTRWKVVAKIKEKTSPLRGYPPLVVQKKKEKKQISLSSAFFPLLVLETK